MEFNVSVQGAFYKTLAAANTGAALSAVAEDIAAGLVPGFDETKPHNISITPVAETDEK